MIRGFNPSRRLLAIPLGLYFLLSLIYLFAIPVGESPDEPGHLQCVEQVARLHRLPIVDPKPEGKWFTRGYIISGNVCYHMPLYYVVGGSLQRAIASVKGDSLHFEFPPNNPHFIGSGVMFLHEDKTTFWLLPEPATLIGLRLLSIGLGLALLWACYDVARRVFPGQEDTAVLSMTLAAGWPQFVYLSRAISNDVLATALAAGILIVLLQVGRPNRFIGAAALSALAVLTKLSVLFTVGAVLGGWLLEVIILRERKSLYFRALLGCLAVWGIVGTIVMAQPTLRENWRLSAGGFTAVSPKVSTIAYWQDVLKLTLSSGWARFGWMSVPAPLWHAYSWWAGILLAGGAGLAAAWRGQHTKHACLKWLILSLWGSGLLIIFLRINLNRLQPQFRFVLASLPMITTFAAAGLLSWVERRRHQWGRTIIILSALFLFAYNLWLILVIVKSAYGWQLS